MKTKFRKPTLGELAIMRKKLDELIAKYTNDAEALEAIYKNYTENVKKREAAETKPKAPKTTADFPTLEEVIRMRERVKKAQDERHEGLLARIARMRKYYQL